MYLQVIDDLKRKIINKEILENGKFPSTRELAIEYGINPNTAARVYNEMELMGICYSKKGLGTYLTNNEEMITNLKKSVASKHVKTFMKEMHLLGFTNQEILYLIKGEGSEEK
ncbi:MAG: GntR family transcriptional regulator [Clostridia bacterium]|nr:GntR family transcriptional regulator [Clostridia bacterium]